MRGMPYASIAGAVCQADGLAQDRFGLPALAQPTIPPVVVAAGGDLERFTKGAPRVVRPGLLSRVRRRCGRFVAFAGKPGRSLCQNIALHLDLAQLAP